MPDNNWLLNDSTPTPVGQEFAPPAAAWTGVYWGPGQLAFNPAETAGAASVAPGTGALTAAGVAPTVAVSDNKSAAPGTGALAATGLPPTAAVSNNQSAAPGTGAVAAAGLAPTLAISDNKSAAPGTGALSAAGLAPIVTASNHQRALPGTGALVAAGLAPTVAIPSIVEGVVDEAGRLIPTGQLVLVRFNAAVSDGGVGLAIGDSTGEHGVTVSINGLDVPTAYDSGIGTASLAFMVSGSLGPNDVLTVRYVAAGAAIPLSWASSGILLLDSGVRAVLNHLGAATQTGALDATGYAPAVAVGVSVAPQVGALAAQGFAPTVLVEGSAAVEPGTGELLAEGFAPVVVGSTPEVEPRTPSQGGYASWPRGRAEEREDEREPVAFMPGVGALIATGYAPTVRIAPLEQPAVVAPAATAFAPPAVFAAPVAAAWTPDAEELDEMLMLTMLEVV